MKAVTKLILGLSFTATVLTSCAGEYYVADRPAEPVYVRPVAPYADAYWVPGEWFWSGNRYVYRNGYYAHARRGYTYAPGYWRRGSRGHVWVRGGWRR